MAKVTVTLARTPIPFLVDGRGHGEEEKALGRARAIKVALCGRNNAYYLIRFQFLKRC